MVEGVSLLGHLVVVVIGLILLENGPNLGK
jgi:hypothetical protein